MGVRHSTLGPPAGNFSTIPLSRHTPSRFGPSHCGQSSARAVETVTVAAAVKRQYQKRVGRMAHTPSWKGTGLCFIVLQASRRKTTAAIAVHVLEHHFFHNVTVGAGGNHRCRAITIGEPGSSRIS